MSAVARPAPGGTMAAGEEWPVMRGSPGDAAITDLVLAPLWHTRRIWWMLFALSAAGTLLLLGTVAYTVMVGIGTWGNNIPVAWAFAITNFVWWIGIGHAGTFISAFLLLLNQRWRRPSTRGGAAMTDCARVSEGL